ncbi:hypothetical protein Q7A53_06155 [Halobacillus rhizosphaerae]|uniref:hypothetical protein n=1 Tax=Halobacillus rhizosphaerae TaxID=3064889 RepID=UPI00398B6E3C
MSEVTKITDIYDSFLSRISDYSFLSDNITEEEIMEDLFGYFKSARTKFYKCKNSLKTIDDNGETVFTVELHPFEVEVLVSLMLVEYLKPKVLTDENMKQSLSDKDFKIYSQANQLKEMSLLYRNFAKEARKLITEYSYIDLDKEKW